MKTLWSALAKILFILVFVQAWFLYDFYKKSESLSAGNAKLQQELSRANESLLAANQKIEELEKNSIDHVLKETNKAVVKGWETLLDTVEGELEKAKKSIDSTVDGLRQDGDVHHNSSPSEKDTTIEDSPAIIQGERT